MDLEELQKNWDHLGQEDPLWAILSDPEKKDGKWDKTEFLDTGVKEIEEIFNYINSLGLNAKNERALDFGCGVGRLTQALANYFIEVIGIDIAPSMINLANRYNSYPEKCKYYVNDTNDLRIFKENYFDFIYTSRVLQHMEPSYAKEYLKEFIRILAPNGLLIFQIPGEKTSESKKSYKHQIEPIIPYYIKKIYLKIYFRLKYWKSEIIEMYGLNKADLIKLIANSNAIVIDIQENNQAGKEWKSYRFCVKKE